MSVDLDVESFVFFGDSLSSDNPTIDNHSSVVPVLLGIERVSIYAHDGATALDYADGRGPEFYLEGQVDAYLADTGADLSGAVAGILIGGNDYAQRGVINQLGKVPMDQVAIAAYGMMEAVVAETLEAAQTLVDAGVGKVVLYTQPSASFYPMLEAVLDGAASAFDVVGAEGNARLFAGAEALTEAGGDVVVVDLFALAAEMLDDPKMFGLLAPWQSVHQGPDSDYAEDQYAFNDGLHPSAAGQGVIAAFSAASLTATAQFGGETGDRFKGDGNADLMLGAAGSDTLILRGGDDTALGGRGKDLLRGGSGEDILAGGTGRDVIFGGRGADVLAGGPGNDKLIGGAGRDLLIGGAGKDKLFGGRGNDEFVFIDDPHLNGNGTQIAGGRGEDRLTIVTDADTIALLEQDSEITDIELTDTFGLQIESIEEIVLLVDVPDQDYFGGNVRVAEADLWGLL